MSVWKMNHDLKVHKKCPKEFGGKSIPNKGIVVAVCGHVKTGLTEEKRT